MMFVLNLVRTPALGAAVGIGFCGFEISNRVKGVSNPLLAVQASPNSTAAEADGTPIAPIAPSRAMDSNASRDLMGPP